MATIKIRALPLAAIAVLAMSAPIGALAQSNENGYGPDPDGDTNPATRTRAVANVGATDVNLNPRFTIMNFEPPPGVHGGKIRDQYASKNGVAFGKGLKWQICDDQRYFQYDSLCTYIRPPSGLYAAYYRDDRKSPLKISFNKPVCAVMMSIYPPGGREGEKFTATLKAKNSKDEDAGTATITFAWTLDTFRWRVMAGGFFLKEPASSLDVTIARAENPGEVIQFLIDDLAYIETGCDAALEEIKTVAGFVVSEDGVLEAVGAAGGK